MSRTIGRATGLSVRTGSVPLWMMLVLGAVLVVALAIWTQRSASDVQPDGKQTIVFWGPINSFGDDLYTVLHHFEQANPQYRIVLGTAVARDLTGDAQRMLCAVAGGVPPDLVFFDRFAIGEWAGRGALTDLTPYVEQQRKTLPDGKPDPLYLDLSEYYPWSISEASYAPPGSGAKPGIFGIPLGVDIRVLYSNADILRQQGLVDEKGDPRPPRNWEELREDANKLTRYIRPGDKSSGISQLGFGPNYGNSWLYIYAWQAGGEFMNSDRTKVTLNTPPVRRALQYMTDIYDDLGGVKQVDAFQSSFQQGELDPFLRGQVAMKIDGDWSLAGIADWKRDMDFIISPAPMPQDQLDKGRKPITWAGGWALVIPTTSRNKDGAWKLLQYLRSHQAMDLLEQGKREQKESEGRLYLPGASANRVYYEELIRKYVDGNPAMPPRFKQAYAVLRDMMPNTLFRPVTPVGQLLWQQHRAAYETCVNHQYAGDAKAAGRDEAEYCLAKAQEPVQQALDEIIAPLPPETRVNWTPYFVAYAVLIVLPFALMLAVYRRRKKEYSYKAREIGAAMLFASPWILGFIVFVGGPILFSIVFSFTRHDVLKPAHYVGLENYRQIFRDDLFYQSLWNTCFMVLRIPLTMAVSLAIAMLLDRGIRGIGIYRTAFFMPSIVPMVAASLLWIWIFNPAQGLFNPFLNWFFDHPPLSWLGAALGTHIQAPPWLSDPNWSKPGLIIMNLWGAGGGMIIWLAGLQWIPPQLYEAASIDGAGAWKRFRHVTLPMLSPYILFNAIIGLIGTMQIFGEAFIMTEGGPSNSTLFYAYHLFKEAFQYFRMGRASALAWVLFVIVLALTLVQLWLSKKWVHYDRS